MSPASYIARKGQRERSEEDSCSPHNAKHIFWNVVWIYHTRRHRQLLCALYTFDPKWVCLENPFWMECRVWIFAWRSHVRVPVVTWSFIPVTITGIEHFALPSRCQTKLVFLLMHVVLVLPTHRLCWGVLCFSDSMLLIRVRTLTRPLARSRQRTNNWNCVNQAEHVVGSQMIN